MCRAPPVTMATLPTSRVHLRKLEYWNAGILRNGGHHFIVPSFTIPMFHFFISAFQMLFKVSGFHHGLIPSDSAMTRAAL